MFLLALVCGLTLVFHYIPYKKRQLQIAEMVRACNILGRIETEKGLDHVAALKIFDQLNPRFFPKDTEWKTADFEAGVKTEAPCTPHPVPDKFGHLQLRVDESHILETNMMPPRPDQIALAADREGADSYEIQHHHPVIFGRTPEAVTAWILVAFLTAGFLSSFVAVYVVFVIAMKNANRLLDRMAAGDLKVRFPNAENPLMSKFNQMADEIEKLVRQLKEAENVRFNLLQELTHDLKTPVASLRSLLESIRDKHAQMSERDFEDFLDTSIHETVYFSRLVEDLLFISGVSEPHDKEDLRVDVASLIESELRPMGQIENVRAVFANPGPKYFYGEEILLRRLIRNGLDNAIYFADSKVEVRLHENNGCFHIEIANDGPPASRDDVAQFGVKRTTRKVQQAHDGHISLGLGSVIMRKIARSYGGDAILSPEAGGTTLKITLSQDV